MSKPTCRQRVWRLSTNLGVENFCDRRAQTDDGYCTQHHAIRTRGFARDLAAAIEQARAKVVQVALEWAALRPNARLPAERKKYIDACLTLRLTCCALRKLEEQS